MFAKLLKREWRETRSVILLLCAVILLSGVTIGLCTRYLGSQAGDTIRWLEMVSTTLAILGFLVLGACCAASLIYLLYHYYSSRFTSQGYLTFTLPAGHHSLLLSSILNTVLCILLVLVAAVASMGIALWLTVLADNARHVTWGDVTMTLGYLLKALSEAYADYVPEILALAGSGVLWALSRLVVLMLAVTAGSLLAKKHKILMGVAVYYAISLVVGIFNALLTLTGAFDSLVVGNALLSAALLLDGYYAMYFLTSRKLNLN